MSHDHSEYNHNEHAHKDHSHAARAKDETVRLAVSGLDCPDCAASLESAVQSLPIVDWARLDFTLGELTIRPSNGVDPLPEIRRLAQSMGHDVQAMDADSDGSGTSRWAWLRSPHNISTVLAGLFLFAALAVLVFGGATWLRDGLFILSILSGAWLVARAGWVGLWRGHKLDMNALMTIAALGAVAVGEYAEGAVTMLLFSIGEFLESHSADRARNAIRELMRMAPDVATLLGEQGAREVAVAEVQIGQRILVKPGERVPLDGVIIEGQSALDQSSVTGEPIPVDRGQGDDVYAGTVNGVGALTVEVTRVAADSTVARIARLIQDAQSERAPVERFVDRFANIYTPAVVGLAALIAVVPPLLGLGAFSEWVYRALVLLVISCPCALVISTPVTLVSALARGAQLGVLIKGGRYVEALSRVRAVAFDKTGTLTVGKPQVIARGCNQGEGHDLCAVCDELVAKAAAVERRSEHALAEAVLTFAQKRQVDLRYDDGEGIQAVVGQGIKGLVDGDPIVVGRHGFVHDGAELGAHGQICREIDHWEDSGHTVLTIYDGASTDTGYLVVSDSLRPEAAQAVRELRERVEQVVMLTGDNAAVARNIASELGLDQYRAGLMPQDKVGAAREIAEQVGAVAMVGDGINDAPALAAADVGIAMGAAGSDVALETADVALMGGDLGGLVTAIDLSRRAMRTVRANITFALVVKLVFVLLAVLGYANLWLAVFADVGTSMLVSLNGLRLLRFKPQRS